MGLTGLLPYRSRENICGVVYTASGVEMRSHGEDIIDRREGGGDAS